MVGRISQEQRLFPFGRVAAFRGGGSPESWKCLADSRAYLFMICGDVTRFGTLPFRDERHHGAARNPGRLVERTIGMVENVQHVYEQRSIKRMISEGRAIRVALNEASESLRSGPYDNFRPVRGR